MTGEKSTTNSNDAASGRYEPKEQCDDGSCLSPSRATTSRVSSLVAGLVPIVLIIPFAETVPAIVATRVFRQEVCRSWYAAEDPGKIPLDGPIPHELCFAAGVEQRWGAVIELYRVIDRIGFLMGICLAYTVARKFEHKPVILTILGVSLLYNVVNAGLQSSFQSSEIANFALAQWAAFKAFVREQMLVFVGNLAIADMVSAEQRTVALSKFSAWATLGQMAEFICPMLVGFGLPSTKHAGLAFVCAAVLQAGCMLCVWFLLPAARPQYQSEKVPQRDVDGPQLQDLAQQHSLTGRRNWLLCSFAVYALMAGASRSFAVMTVSTSRLGRVSSMIELGAMLMLPMVGSIVAQMMLIPLAVKRFSRTLSARVRPQGEAPAQGEPVPNIPADALDRFNINIAMISLLVSAAALIVVSLAPSPAVHFIALFVFGLGAGHTPVMRSVIISMAGSSQKGFALAAMEVIMQLGLVLSTDVTSRFVALDSIPIYATTLVHGVQMLVAILALSIMKGSSRL
ncbi:hypothetical protein WOLCODRAFT_167613 [Wolfiporia cocos MD-104 SS10]|uniref:Uncharacterized protein n=1 Tax=Wolfiporia cocos (strain MD-104) TaxID=742152 RepID=A0A2H3JIM0_WOLCO|nr:hypothetical protein WOLCODRAFT_167613 [Wolfiporia cocos MD-104 SS10]